MIRVLVVDDSAVVRKVLTNELSRFSDIDVVGTATDPYVARERIVSLKPDVITLDIEMPRMNGLTFLSHLMQHYPLPVVIVSSVAQASSQAALQALALGAVDVVAKPSGAYSIPEVGRELVRAIRTASRVRPQLTSSISGAAAQSTSNTQRPLAPRVSAPNGVPARAQALTVIAVGASTGGTKAVEAVLARMPGDTPGIVIVQHMPAGFTASFAKRLDSISEMTVHEACDNDPVLPGHVLIAPGGLHMVLRPDGGKYKVGVKDGPRVHHQKPAVDVLFNSVAEVAGANSIGVLLTGMGSDGAKGLLAMRQAGAHTMAEAESTCVVYGMPREAIELGAAKEVVPLPGVSSRILTALS